MSQSDGFVLIVHYHSAISILDGVELLCDTRQNVVAF